MIHLYGIKNDINLHNLTQIDTNLRDIIVFVTMDKL